MEVAKVFETGRSQAVRLPKKYRFQTDEVVIQRLGDAVLMAPRDSVWKTFMHALEGFSDDIFPEGRDQGVVEAKPSLTSSR